jgi:hypothetical protein
VDRKKKRRQDARRYRCLSATDKTSTPGKEKGRRIPAPQRKSNRLKPATNSLLQASMMLFLTA